MHDRTQQARPQLRVGRRDRLGELVELRLPGDPVTVVGRVLRASREQDTETFVGLFAADGYIEGPYRPKGVPGRVTGRDRIREFLTAQADAPWPGPPEMIARLAVHLHSVTLTDVILRLVYGATPGGVQD